MSISRNHHFPEFSMLESASKKACAEGEPQKPSEWLKLLYQHPTVLPSDLVQKFQNSARFQTLFREAISYTEEDIAEMTIRCSHLSVLHEIATRFSDCMDEYTKAALQKHISFMLNCPVNLAKADLSALHHIRFVFEELRSTPYTRETISTVLKILLKMTALGIHQETLTDYLALKRLEKTAIAQGELEENLECSRYFVKSKDGSQNIAKVRQKNLSAGCKENEVLAYEVEHTLGGDHVPPAKMLKFGNTLQMYIPDATTLDDFLDRTEGGAKFIRGLDPSTVQAYLIMSIIRGRGDGHGGNSVIQKDGRLHDIDEEDDFRCTFGSLDPYDACESKGLKLAALGFPQSAQPLSRVLLKLFSWEGMKHKALNQFKIRKKYSSKFLENYLETVIHMCRLECQKVVLTLTPRDIFFMINGKDYLYEMNKVRKYTDYEFFRGQVCVYDDQFMKSDRKAITAEIYDEEAQKWIFDESRKEYDRNVKELDAPFVIPKFSMKSPKYEQYPGTFVVQKLWKLRKKDSLLLFKIKPGAFDQAGWEQYKESCSKESIAEQNFMLAHFLQGFARRMARQLVKRLPGFPVSVVKCKSGNLSVKICKPKELVEIEFRIAQMKEGPGTIRVMRIEKKNFNLKQWKNYLNIKEFDPTSQDSRVEHSEELCQYLSGSDRVLSNWIRKKYVGDLLNDSSRYLSIEEADDGYYLTYNRV